MSYYNNPEYKERGIDYDLCACMENNALPFSIDDIEKVLAVWEGENDGDAWRWVLTLKDGRTMFVKGGCDFTGWDCQSWAEATHMTDLDMVFEDDEDVYNSLMNQIFHHGRKRTWRESKDEEFRNES